MSKFDLIFGALWVVFGVYFALASTLTPWLGVAAIVIGLGYLAIAVSPRARELLGSRHR